jgi:hypothetical protein
MTISRIENGHSGGHADTMRKLQTTLQAAGVEFIDDERGQGVVKLRGKS